MITLTERQTRVRADFDEDFDEKPDPGPPRLRGIEGMSVALFDSAVHDASDYILPLVDIIDARQFIERCGWRYLSRCGTSYHYDIPNEEHYRYWLEEKRGLWDQAGEKIVECRQHRPAHVDGARTCPKCRRVVTIFATLDILHGLGLEWRTCDTERRTALTTQANYWTIYQNCPNPNSLEILLDLTSRIRLTRTVLRPLVREYPAQADLEVTLAEAKAEYRVADLKNRLRGEG